MDDLMLDEGFVRLRERKGGKQAVVPIDRETVRAIKQFKLIRRDTDLDYLFVNILDDRLTKTVIQRAIRDAAVSEELCRIEKIGSTRSSRPIPSGRCSRR